MLHKLGLVVLLHVEFTHMKHFLSIPKTALISTSKYGNLSFSHLVCYLLSHVQLFGTPYFVARQAPLSMEGKNTGVGCHFLLQGIFLSQGLKLGLLYSPICE